jgi:hypothetical protein
VSDAGAVRDPSQPKLEPRQMLTDGERAVLYDATQVAARIVTGEVSARDGATQIWDMSLNLDDSPLQLHTFIYAASEWATRSHMDGEFTRGVTEAAYDLIDLGLGTVPEDR